MTRPRTAAAAAGILCSMVVATLMTPGAIASGHATEFAGDPAVHAVNRAAKSTAARTTSATRTAAKPAFIVPRAKPKRAASPAASPQATPRRSPFGVFGSIEFKTGKLSAIREWARVRKRIDRERVKYTLCDRDNSKCPANLRGWRAKLAALDGVAQLQQLRRLNRFINSSVTYRTDDLRFGKPDYWATPRQILGSAGDCEDYAIAKFYSLIDLGFSNDQMRIVVVKDTIRRIAHAVLAVDLDNKTYIMDSLFDEPVPHQYVLQYEPVYSVNLTTRWAHIVTPEIKRKFVSQFVDGTKPNRTRPERNDSLVRLTD